MGETVFQGKSKIIISDTCDRFGDRSDVVLECLVFFFHTPRPFDPDFLVQG